MNKYEDKPGDAVLFENEKQGNDKAPDHKGFIIAHRDIKSGEKLSIALWNRDSNSLTLKGKVEDMKPRKEATAPVIQSEDTIPF